MGRFFVGNSSRGEDHLAQTSFVSVGFGQPVKFVPHAFNKRITVTTGFPKVTISQKAFEAMCKIVKETTSEVGWLGTVEVKGNIFHIEEIFLPKQMVNSVTCEITAAGMAELATELLKRPDGQKVCNSIRFWGHVHPSNDTSPSAQDNDQMKVFEASCEDFFLRGILGRHGRMEFTLFWYEKGMTFHDVAWNVVEEKKTSANKPSAPSVSLGRKVANCVGTLCDRVVHGKKPKPEEEVSKSSDQQLPPPKPGKESEGDAENQFLDLVARIEMLMGTRLIKWANGRNLPLAYYLYRIGSMTLAELESLIEEGPCPDAARDELLIRQAISNLNAFMASGAKLPTSTVDSHVTTQVELASMESMAFQIGTGELNDVEKIYDFYDEVVRIMMRRGLGEFLQLYVDQGFLDRTFLARYRRSRQED